MRKSTLLVVLMLLLSMTVVFAAAQGETAAKQKIVHYHWTETSYDKINNEAVKMFQEKHPEVEINMLLLADADRANQIRIALASNGEIDSFALSNMEAAEFHAAKQMQVIDPKGFGKSTVQQVVDMWEPNSIEISGGFWEGQYYGIPFELSNYVAWINTKFMQEAGLDKVNDIPKTWDDFFAVAKKMTVDQGGVRVRNGFATNSKAAGFPFLIMSAIAAQQGFDWLTEEGFKKSINDPKIAVVISTMTDMVTKYKIWDPGLFDDEREGFGTGKTATFLTGGSWYWGVLDNWGTPRTDVAAMAYPRFADGEDFGGIGYGYCLYVSRLAKNPTLTWEFLDTMASQPNEFIKLGYNQPRKTLDKDLALKSIPAYEVFATETAKASPILMTTKMAEVQDMVWASATRVIFEGMDLNKSIEILRSDINGLF
ncbi:MAG: extracellular solute-binding protein [Sphaerochaetaceae bacterium]|nr:extracellular solute-binding protein [Sphaerochaetaceae bacterium]